MDTDFRWYGVLANDVVNVASGTNIVNGDLNSYGPINMTGTLTVIGQNNTGTVITDPQAYYDNYTSRTPDVTYSNDDIGGMTFTPGVIQLTSSNVSIGLSTPTITLDGNGFYLFQIPNGGLSTNTASSSVSFMLNNGAMASNVFWAINGDVTLSTTSSNITNFIGTILSTGNITLGANCTSAGGLIAFGTNPTGNVTLNGNVIYSQNLQYKLDKTLTNVTLFEQQPSGTNGGTFTAGTVVTRNLNTMTGKGSVTLASNQFTILPGYYAINAYAPAYKVNGHQISLYNVTTNQVEVHGTSAIAGSSDGTTSSSIVNYNVFLPQPTTYKINHQCTSTQTDTGLGVPVGIGTPEIYTVVQIIQIAQDTH